MDSHTIMGTKDIDCLNETKDTGVKKAFKTFLLNEKVYKRFQENLHDSFYTIKPPSHQCHTIKDFMEHIPKELWAKDAFDWTCAKEGCLFWYNVDANWMQILSHCTH